MVDGNELKFTIEQREKGNAKSCLFSLFVIVCSLFVRVSRFKLRISFVYVINEMPAS
jgi:hypothetical protein